MNSHFKNDFPKTVISAKIYSQLTFVLKVLSTGQRSGTESNKNLKLELLNDFEINGVQ
jgi:hypothetical protein